MSSQSSTVPYNEHIIAYLGLYTLSHLKCSKFCWIQHFESKKASSIAPINFLATLYEVNKLKRQFVEEFVDKKFTRL